MRLPSRRCQIRCAQPEHLAVALAVNCCVIGCGVTVRVCVQSAGERGV